MEKKVKDFKKYLLEIAAKESHKDIQMGMLLSIMHLQGYETGEYVTLSEIAYEMYKIIEDEKD